MRDGQTNTPSSEAESAKLACRVIRAELRQQLHRGLERKAVRG